MNLLITGANGMVGKSLVPKISKKKIKLLIPTSKELNLINLNQTRSYFKKNKIDSVIHLAARVGGILDNYINNYKYFEENNFINSNLIKVALENDVTKFINLGSSCMYPSHISKKMSEKILFTGKPEKTNLGYALAKLSSAGICEVINRDLKLNYTTLIPCNLYGPNDNFSMSKSHLIAAAIRKCIRFKKGLSENIEIYGNGKVKREFMYVDDLSNFIIKIIFKNNIKHHYINCGYGKDYTVTDFYKKICKILKIKNNFKFDLSKPSGISRKLIDCSLAKKFYGFKVKTSIDLGLIRTIDFYEKNYE